MFFSRKRSEKGAALYAGDSNNNLLIRPLSSSTSISRSKRRPQSVIYYPDKKTAEGELLEHSFSSTPHLGVHQHSQAMDTTQANGL